jgi:ATP-dependent Lon protease
MINIYNNQWIYFYGHIKNDDYLLMSVKSHNIYNDISNYIIQKKLNIENVINDNDIYKKQLIKYIELWELVSMDNDELLNYINENHKKYIELNNKSFNYLMKEFLNNSSKNITNCFDIIKLLLLGSEDNINVAGLLYSLLYEKKNIDFHLIAHIIYYNLIFVNQVKLKKISYNLKNELEKLNDLSYENIDYKKQLAINKNIPNYIKSLVLEKINEMKLNNNDQYKQLTFIKTILHFPWSCNNDIFFDLHKNIDSANLFIKNIQKNLNTITYGHQKAKDKLLLQIGQWISNPNSKGNAISFCGSPGVGKTLLAKSLGKILNIPFVQITLGGQNDGELLHGHAYTYSSAQPGMIIKKIVEAGSSRCILYFDELDKTSVKNNNNNEIMNILIHLTDPNMNKTFQDRFFQGIDFPLDKVIFMMSYNDSSKIDPILLDRLIEINIKSYNIFDKLNIVENYILNEIKTMVGLDCDIVFYKDDMKRIIEDYTNESGVRQIKKIIEDVFLKINIDKILNKNKYDIIHLTYDFITNLLNNLKKIHFDKINDENEIGLINGLYATNNGNGGIIKIQIKKNIFGDKNIITGNVGNSMKESIDVAYTLACDYINKNKDKYNIDNFEEYLRNNFKSYHIHCGDISTNKDGPSATTLITICFISIILNKKINQKISCTSEANLQGNLMKIGGLEYKLFGAKRSGIEKVIICKDNEDDLIEIKKNYNSIFDENFDCIILNTLNDVIDLILIN